MVKRIYSIGIIGAGSWGTAIAKVLTNNRYEVSWWAFEQEIIEHLPKYHHNPLYLSGAEFDVSKIKLSSDVNVVVDSADVLFLAVPAAFLDHVLKAVDPAKLKGKYLVSAIKGIVPSHRSIVATYLHEAYGLSYDNLAVVSGPSHAEEVALEKLTYLTIASQNRLLADYLASLFRNRYIKAGTTDDIYGTEYAAVLKNIFAVAVGISKGLGYGDNFLAVLITNAMEEMKRFIDAVHPIERELIHSCYLGDLLVTSYSQFSRNRSFGVMIGSGYSVRIAQLEMKMVAEGYYAVEPIHDIAQKVNVEMPIVNAVYNILYEGISPTMEMHILSDKLV
jgi:glycerol-3-phosphate dehydrogenase (NAD(P)+)